MTGPPPPFAGARLPLALGLVAMTLSEAGSWNIRQISAAVAARGPLAALPGVAAALAVYTLLAALLVDAALRWRVRDGAGLLLLGSLYGLANEGLFAPHLVTPAGLDPVFLLFPTLSWHAALDGALTVAVARAFLEGRLDLSQPRLSPRETLLLIAACGLWFPWSFAPWLPPAPPGILALFLLAPFLLLAGIVPGGGRPMASAAPLLGPRARGIAWAALALAALHLALRAPFGFLCWSAICFVHLALFRLTRPAGSDAAARDFVTDGGPRPAGIPPSPRPVSRGKILRAALLACLLFVAWRLAVPAFGLAPAVARGCALAAVAGGLFVPAVTLLLAARAILRGRPPASSGSTGSSEGEGKA